MMGGRRYEDDVHLLPAPLSLTPPYRLSLSRERLRLLLLLPPYLSLSS